ncbi:transcriptional regulator, TetR family [Nocardia amikacinitolerans]|nr:transcriptional regulator, TetR family [Nocardia amikacinitolerans]
MEQRTEEATTGAEAGLSSGYADSMTAETDSTSAARERILAAAYLLFTRRGIRDVGVDEVIARAGIAKATLYRHFRTKDDLVLAVLRRREKLWTFGFVEERSRLLGQTPEERLLAIFDVFDEWFNGPDFDACTFINVLLEMGAEHPAGRASIEHLDNIRGVVRARAQSAGLREPDEFARSWHILMKGSIVSAAEGDRQAARRAREMARALIAAHRPGRNST